MEKALRLSQQAMVILQDGDLTGEEICPEKAFVNLQFARQLIECDLQKAEQMAQESVKLYREIADDWGTANALEALNRDAPPATSPRFNHSNDQCHISSVFSKLMVKPSQFAQLACSHCDLAEP